MVLLKIPKLEPIVEYSCMFFAGSVLALDALVHLLPHALEGAEDHGTASRVGLAAVAGCMAVLIVADALEDGHCHSHSSSDTVPKTSSIQAYGWANLATEMLHNFVDGISIGLAFLNGSLPGFSVALAVAVHELPQELGDFIVLRSAGFPTGKLLWWNMLVSLTCVGGVGLVHALGASAMTDLLRRYLTAFTAGSFLALALNMIFPKVLESIRKEHHGRSALKAKALCCVLGAFAVWLMIKLGELEGDAHDHGHGHGHGHGHRPGEL